MRILLDECVPAPLRRELPRHEVRTVPSMRWWGLKNGALIRQAATEFDIFLTVDQSPVKQQNLPQNLAIITIRASSNRITSIRPLIPAILAAIESIVPGEQVLVEG